MEKNWHQSRGFIEFLRVQNLSLHLNKHHTIKTYWEMEVSLHAILNSVIREVSFRPGVHYSGETPYGTHYESSFLSNAPLFPNKYCFFRRHSCFSEHEYGVLVERYGKWKTKALGKKPVPAPPCPPQISQPLTWDRTRACTVGRRRLTAWAMVRPVHIVQETEWFPRSVLMLFKTV